MFILNCTNLIFHKIIFNFVVCNRRKWYNRQIYSEADDTTMEVMEKVQMKKVMLIDDNEIDIFINQKVLEFNDFAESVINIQAAQEAIDVLQKGNEEDIPNVIFLDLNMPIVDGFKFLFEFSKMNELVRSKVKIIVLTSSDNVRDKEKVAANPDVLAYISKPLTDSKLELISSML